MERPNLFFFLFFFLFSLLTGNQYVQGSSHHHQQSHQRHRLHRGLYGFEPTKLFVFGDSYADTGNTRKSNSSSWKVPYGITFPGKPAGRFSSGRIFTDFLAKSVGLKSPIAYRWIEYALDPLKYGINFAYGGTGVFDTLVSGPNMTTQIEFFQNLVNSSVYNTSDLQSSMALVTCAGNDYSAYVAKGGSLQDLPTFINHVVRQLGSNLKRIHDMGVRKVAVAALQPLGCLPRGTVQNSFQQCNDTENFFATIHNVVLSQTVANLNNETNDPSAFLILDLYHSFSSLLQNNTAGSLKFETPLKPCCVGISSEHSCGDVDEKGENMYTVCENPESAFFWDMVHPTQAGWSAAFLALNSTLGTN